MCVLPVLLQYMLQQRQAVHQVVDVHCNAPQRDLAAGDVLTTCCNLLAALLLPGLPLTPLDHVQHLGSVRGHVVVAGPQQRLVPQHVGVVAHVVHGGPQHQPATGQLHEGGLVGGAVPRHHQLVAPAHQIVTAHVRRLALAALRLRGLLRLRHLQPHIHELRVMGYGADLGAQLQVPHALGVPRVMCGAAGAPVQQLGGLVRPGDQRELQVQDAVHVFRKRHFCLPPL
mmetsp:Transcript_29620/g.65578  ORF Transcript_29620/g.65578 Transcript_29620/m.65578 type:complete len:228 (+) Transcript_29620:857-1540(+)